MINQYYSHKQLKYSLYNGIRNTYFGMLSYIMLNLITNKPTRIIDPIPPRKPKKPSKRISARQVQNNLEAFIKEQRAFNEEQRQTNKILLEFAAETKQFMLEQREFNDEQRKFNKLVLTRLDKIEARIDNLVVKNNLVE